MSDWRPIETAPKDGALIHIINNRGQFIVFWSGDYPPEECLKEWWVVFDGKYCKSLRGNEPTHWMPLPPPPETAG